MRSFILLRYLPVAALIVAGSFSCLNSSNNVVLGFDDSITFPKDSATKYFPEKGKLKDTVFNNNALSPFEDRWYSQMLFGLHEPVLYNYLGGLEIYRFTWLRSFNNPFSFRIQKKGTDAFLVVKQASGKGGYNPGKIVVDTIIPITQIEWNNFIERVERMKYWETPMLGEQCETDGAQWILEGTSGKHYHLSIWCSPSLGRGDGFKDCCQYLLTLSGIKIPKEEMY